jgi:hypothetical protein
LVHEEEGLDHIGHHLGLEEGEPRHLGSGGVRREVGGTVKGGRMEEGGGGWREDEGRMEEGRGRVKGGTRVEEGLDHVGHHLGLEEGEPRHLGPRIVREE